LIYTKIATANIVSSKYKNGNYWLILFSWAGAFDILEEDGATAISGSIAASTGSNNPLVIPPGYTLDFSTSGEAYGFQFSWDELVRFFVG
jgi:hypothetical protein